jgi:uroporphyrinogen-III synthase
VKVLVTGTEAGGCGHLGIVVHTPLIELTRVGRSSAIDACIHGAHNTVLFTSRYAVKFWMEHLKRAGKGAAWFSGRTVISIGRVTSAELCAYGVRPEFQAEEESSSGLVDIFRREKITGRSVLIPRSDKAPEDLPCALTALGNNVQPVVVYTNCLPASVVKVDLSEFGAVVFSSPSGVRNFIHVYGTIPAHLKVIARGAQVEAELARQSVREGR